MYRTLLSTANVEDNEKLDSVGTNLQCQNNNATK